MFDKDGVASYIASNGSHGEAGSSGGNYDTYLGTDFSHTKMRRTLCRSGETEKEKTKNRRERANEIPCCT